MPKPNPVFVGSWVAESAAWTGADALGGAAPDDTQPACPAGGNLIEERTTLLRSLPAFTSFRPPCERRRRQLLLSPPFPYHLHPPPPPRRGLHLCVSSRLRRAASQRSEHTFTKIRNKPGNDLCFEPKQRGQAGSSRGQADASQPLQVARFAVPSSGGGRAQACRRGATSAPPR